ncbi:LytR C-terminal domain-containing protein [Microbacterium sp. bgisy203]|uniref:LytR C-terminal domain-containing protein n=1 Tax=Microbacterium sp. bgisy203 TaxID=3413799 RepID=UPI003D720BF5
MPTSSVHRTPPTKDRFDDLPADDGRVGAHRAENPRIRGGVVLLWSAIATMVIVGAGIFGSMVSTGSITFFPTPEPTVPAAQPTAEPVLDTTYKVTVLNATGQRGLAGQMRDTLVAAGWSADDVNAGEASEEFDTTTVFYTSPDDEGPARGLAEAIGGAPVELSEAYQGVWGDDSPQLVVVIGADRATSG